MAEDLKPYPEGPGFIKGNEASCDGANLAAPVKPTQEARLLSEIGSARFSGMTSIDCWDRMRISCPEIQLSTVRARLTTLRQTGKIVALPDRRDARFDVAITVYVLPQFAPTQHVDAQGELWAA